jgi:hypothetical protein
LKTNHNFKLMEFSQSKELSWLLRPTDSQKSDASDD